MSKKINTELENLSLGDRQLLEICGEEVLHRSKKAKVLLQSKNFKTQFKSN